MSTIADFTESELWILKTALRERYRRDLELELADASVRLRLHDRELTTCPAVYWSASDCHFVVLKTGDRRYRCQFYYRGHEQYGTGVEEYDDLADCVITLLRVQADQQSARRGDFPGS